MSARQHRLLILFALLLAAQAAFTLFAYFGELQGGGRFGGDFVSFWSAAQRLHEGAPVYDADHWRSVLGGKGAVELSWFVYPPFALFGVWPLGGMSYERAVLWWSLAPLPFYFGLLWLLARRSGLPAVGRLVIAAMTLPFLAANLFTGQTGAIVAVFFLATAFFWRERPLLAGICISLIAVKPQMGLLLPFALAASGQWRTVAAAATTILALSLAATLWLGPTVWSDYLAMSALFGQFIGQGYDGISQLALGPFVSLQAAGAPIAIAAAVQGAVTLAVLAVVTLHFRQIAAAPLDLRLGLLASGALLATPYALTYDMPVLGLALVPLVARVWRGELAAMELPAIAMLVAAPFVPEALIALHLPFALASLLLTFAALHRACSRAARQTAPAEQPVATPAFA